MILVVFSILFAVVALGTVGLLVYAGAKSMEDAQHQHYRRRGAR